MIVAGLGCRRGETAENVIDALLASTRTHGLSLTAITALATGSLKADEPAIRRAATSLGIPLTILSRGELEAAAPRVLTSSDQSLRHTGLPSLCETAALAAAGTEAALVGPRFIHGGITVALAATSAKIMRQSGDLS